MTIVRAHTWENVAPAAKTLLAQINAAFPQRKLTNAGKDADGIWPSPAHTAANPNSDHEGGNAVDIDDDLSGRDGREPSMSAEMVRRMSMHPACKYGIHDSGIYYDGVLYPYRGSNPHTGHAHISIMESRRNDTSPWDIELEDEVRYIYGVIVDLGADRTALRAIASKYQDKLVEGSVAVSFHASEGVNADAYISYAESHGLELHTCTDGESQTMVVRSKGSAAPSDAKMRAALASIETAAHNALK